MTKASEDILQSEALTLIQQSTAQDDEAVQQRIQAWTEQSPEHHRIWKETQSLWSAMGQMDNKRFSGLESVWLQSERLALVAGEKVKSPVITALLLMALLLPLFSYWLPSTSTPSASLVSSTATPFLEQYQTGWKQQQLINLADGSSIQLNWDTHLTVTLSSKQRLVELHQGEALFSVSSDPSRPFIVKVGDIAATALGTQYSVRRNSHQQASIQVSEGRVEVSHSRVSEIGLLTQGQTIITDQGQLSPIQHLPTDEIASWEKGVLIYDRRSLVEVLEEMGRYTLYDLDISALANNPQAVTGTYFIDRINEAFQSLAQAFNLETRLENNVLTVYPAKPQKPEK